MGAEAEKPTITSSVLLTAIDGKKVKVHKIVDQREEKIKNNNKKQKNVIDLTK